MNEKETLMANNIVGQSALGGIAFQTQPLPLYSTDPSQSGGSPFTFAALLACFNLKKIFSKKHNSAENLLNHSGSVVCTNTETDLVFIASNEHGTTRDLTKELIRFPISELVSCNFDNYPRSSEVKFQFKSSPEFPLYFIGQQSDAVEFISTLTG